MITLTASVNEPFPGVYRSSYACDGPGAAYCRAMGLTVLLLISELDEELFEELARLLDTIDSPERAASAPGRQLGIQLRRNLA